MAQKATVQTRTEGGKKLTTIAFVVPGKLKVNAQVNEHNLVEKVESWDTNPVLGDMLTETTYTEYKDFGWGAISHQDHAETSRLPVPRSDHQRGQAPYVGRHPGA